jgi:PPK2 family polyphosphate:nucleotide phosphotransferase
MSSFDITEALALKAGSGFQLSEVDPTETPGFTGGKKDLDKVFVEIDDELEELQEKLYANFRAGNEVGSVLLILQGMDTSGKGGVIRHVVGALDPQGVHLAAFGAPTEEELRHDFLWRIKKQLPSNGFIGVFDRSHYEDVLIARVEELAPLEEIETRYQQIREFEKGLVDSGAHIIKVMLHISKDFQYDNLSERLEREDKFWKYDPSDLDARRKWDEYQEAYQIAITETSTDEAPWYVIPGDNKKYARMVVKHLLLETLRAMNLAWPKADFDVEEQKKELEKLK